MSRKIPFRFSCVRRIWELTYCAKCWFVLLETSKVASIQEQNAEDREENAIGSLESLVIHAKDEISWVREQFCDRILFPAICVRSLTNLKQRLCAVVKLYQWTVVSIWRLIMEDVWSFHKSLRWTATFRERVTFGRPIQRTTVHRVSLEVQILPTCIRRVSHEESRKPSWVVGILK